DHSAHAVDVRVSRHVAAIWRARRVGESAVVTAGRANPTAAQAMNTAWEAVVPLFPAFQAKGRGSVGRLSVTLGIAVTSAAATVALTAMAVPASGTAAAPARPATTVARPAGAAAAPATGARATPGQPARATARDRRMAEFAAAAKESGVPARLLLAVGYESRWQDHRGPSADGGYGLMDLTARS